MNQRQPLSSVPLERGPLRSEVRTSGPKRPANTAFSFGEGWFMAVSDHVQVVHATPNVTEASFDEYIAALAGDIDDWPANKQRVALYVVPAAIGMNAAWREKQRRVLAERRDKLEEITLGFALVTSSAVVRGFLTAVFWLAQPPFPFGMVSSVPLGFRALKGHMPSLDTSEALRWYDQCLGYASGFSA